MKLIDFLLILFIGIFIGAVGVSAIIYYPWIIDDRQTPVISEMEEEQKSSEVPQSDFNVALPVVNEMLDWVIQCESSGNHEGVWGREGEYGILQYKQKSFYWLSKKYNFTGDWKNRQDQIDLFLLTSPEDKEIHWTCVRKYLAEPKECYDLIGKMTKCPVMTSE